MRGAVKSAGSLSGRCAAYALALVAVCSCHAQQRPAPDRLAAAFVRQANHTSRAYSVAFNNDGKIPASASWDGTIKLWDTGSGRELRTLAGHSLGVYKAVFSPDGKQLASASRDGTVKIWDASTGACVRTLVAGNAAAGLAVKSVAWSPDGRVLASGGNDGLVKLWDAASGRELRALKFASHPPVQKYRRTRAPQVSAVSPPNRFSKSGNAAPPRPPNS